MHSSRSIEYDVTYALESVEKETLECCWKGYFNGTPGFKLLRVLTKAMFVVFINAGWPAILGLELIQHIATWG